MAEIKMTFNGETRPYIRVLHELERSVFAPITRELLEVPGVAGAYLTGTRTGVREITVPVMIVGTDFSNLQTLKEDLASWLIHDEPKELIFSDEPTRKYYAVVDGDLNTEDIIKHGSGDIKFICPDPYKYGKLVSSDITNGRIVSNTGTADAKPIFDLQVTQKVTFAMVQNGAEDYMMVGVPTDVESKVVDTRTLLLSEDGSTLSTWTPATGSLGTSEGSMSYDGSGIVPASYGTGASYHGPIMYKEIPLTSDFEIEIRGQLHAKIAEIGRFGFAFYDDQSKQLGTIAVSDTYHNVRRKTVTGRVGPYVGQYVNTVISDRNYKLAIDDFPAYMRVKRVGKTFEYYAARVTKTGKHVNAITKLWTVANTDLLKQAKYVTIFFDTIGTHPTAYANRIDYVKVWSLGNATVDQTPYIAYPGDVITFDHESRSILINGVNRTELKDFGARYFTLPKGDNLISVYPEGSFQSNVRFKERFL